MEVEKAPVPSKVPVLFIVQIGFERLVVVSRVYPLFGVPPVAVKIKLPPETVGDPNWKTAAFVKRTLSNVACHVLAGSLDRAMTRSPLVVGPVLKVAE